uniref:Uncharacterized protein n=1 Tax=Metapenaeus ensis majanivirus TaxID=2984279 RepID=A0A9C7EYQ3_9VIRU|nr:MAG: hypothetical protein [Metapenaeus ensis majanivirus]
MSSVNTITFKSTISSIKTRNDIPKKICNILKYSDRFTKKAPYWERQELKNFNKIDIHIQIIDRLYYIDTYKFKEDNIDKILYIFIGRLKPSHQHHVRGNPLYILLKAIENKNLCDFNAKEIYGLHGSIHITAIPSTLLNMMTYLCGSSKSYSFFWPHYRNINNIWKSMVEDDGIQVVSPFESTFKSLVSTIRVLDDIRKIRFIPYFLDKLIIKVLPWEYNNMWDLSNININPDTVDRIYYIHYNKVDKNQWSYQCLARLRSGCYLDRYQRSLYIKFQAHQDQQQQHQFFFGFLYITACAQTFLSIIRHSEKLLYNRYDDIYKFMIKDGSIQKSNSITFKNLTSMKINRRSLDDDYNELGHILKYQNKFIKHIAPWEKYKFEDDINNININALTVDRIYRYYTSPCNQHYQLWLRLRPSYHTRHRYPLYIKLEANRCPSKYDSTMKMMEGSIYIVINAQFYFNIFYSGGDNNNPDNNFIYQLIETDKFQVEKPQVKKKHTFHSLVSSITTADDISKNIGGLRYVLRHQKRLIKKTSPWEREELWDLDNISITAKTVDRVYYISRKKQETEKHYEFLARIVPGHHHRCEMPLYVKLDARCDRVDPFYCNDEIKLEGSIYVTASPQIFLSMINQSNNPYESNRYNPHRIWESMKEKDNIQISNSFLSSTFKSLVPEILKPSDNVGLVHTLPHQHNFTKKTSPWEDMNHIIGDLENISIRPEMVDRVYYSKCRYQCPKRNKMDPEYNNKENKQWIRYHLLARLIPHYHYLKNGQPLYVQMRIESCHDLKKKMRVESCHDLKKKMRGIVYVTIYPQIFLNSITDRCIDLDLIRKSMRDDGIQIDQPLRKRKKEEKEEEEENYSRKRKVLKLGTLCQDKLITNPVLIKDQNQNILENMFCGYLPKTVADEIRDKVYKRAKIDYL